MNLEDFGSRLRLRRQALGLILRDIEAKTGVPVSNLSKIENGKMTPSPAVILRLAEGYDVGVVTMLQWAGLAVTDLTDHEHDVLAVFGDVSREELAFLSDVLVALRARMR